MNIINLGMTKGVSWIYTLKVVIWLGESKSDNQLKKTKDKQPMYFGLNDQVFSQQLLTFFSKWAIRKIYSLLNLKKDSTCKELHTTNQTQEYNSLRESDLVTYSNDDMATDVLGTLTCWLSLTKYWKPVNLLNISIWTGLSNKVPLFQK